MSHIILLIVVVFLAGIYFYGKPIEEFTNQTELTRCPNILIQKDAKFYLYNSKLAKVPGVNPVEFNNLEEYTEFLDWQRSQGIRCPVLYIQQSYDSQGNPVYKIRPSPNDPQGGLNSNILHSKKQIPNLFADIIQSASQLNGDNKNQEIQGISPNPMDPNWGGAEYTQSLVDGGYYAGNEVNLPGR